MEEPKVLLTDKEAAELFSLATSTFRKHVRIGILPSPIHIGRVARWRRADLLKVVDDLANRPTTASDRGAAPDTAPGCRPL